MDETWDDRVAPLRRRPTRTEQKAGAFGVDRNSEGYIEESDTPNRVQYLTGSQFPNLPPMDYVAFAGPSATFVNVTNLLPFIRAMLQLSGQPHTHYLARDVTSRLSPTNLICSKRGAVIGLSCELSSQSDLVTPMSAGTHNSLFSSRADAWLFRQSAYDFAGLTRQGITSHDHYPPRKITLIQRSRRNGRYFENDRDLLDVINATGLELEVVEHLGKIPFKSVVATMAGTGILIAAHGAALVNAMFLPQHAVVIEIFPYYMKKMTFVRDDDAMETAGLLH